ncbi:hypothetical protein P7K49_005496, partial [Saguinus oedipus]
PSSHAALQPHSSPLQPRLPLILLGKRLHTHHAPSPASPTTPTLTHSFPTTINLKMHGDALLPSRHPLSQHRMHLTGCDNTAMLLCEECPPGPQDTEDANEDGECT